MTPSKFDQVVINRANQRVEEKVAAFTKTVGDAFFKLSPSVSPNSGNAWNGGDRAKAAAAIMRTLLGLKGDGCGYPRILWEKEREAVAKELLATMDEMARALAAPEIVTSPQSDSDANVSAEIPAIK